MPQLKQEQLHRVAPPKAASATAAGGAPRRAGAASDAPRRAGAAGELHGRGDDQRGAARPL